MKKSLKPFWLITTLSLITLSCGEEAINGLNSLIQTSEEPAGTNCEFGGVKIESGLDSNSDGVLNPDEVENTEFVCRPQAVNSLLNIIEEPAGVNCESGGLLVESGLDANGNGLLESDEVGTSRYICNGINGPFESQIRFKLSDARFYTSTETINSTELFDFDLSDFVGVDSVVFIADDVRIDNANATLEIQLYDLDNGTPIASSLLSTSSTTAERLYSSNLVDVLPEGRFDVGISGAVINDASGSALGEVTALYLILYRTQ